MMTQDPFADLIPQQQVSNIGHDPFADLVPQQTQEQMSPFMSGVTGFNTGVERTAQGILQPLTESGLLGETVKKASKRVAAQREKDFKVAATANPRAATGGLIGGSVASTVPFATIPGIGEAAFTKGLSQAALSSGLMGLSQYVNPGESRLGNTAASMAFGIPTFGASRLLMAGNPLVKGATGAALGTGAGYYFGGDKTDAATGGLIGASLPFAPGMAGNFIKQGLGKIANKYLKTPSQIEGAATPFAPEIAGNDIKQRLGKVVSKYLKTSPSPIEEVAALKVMKGVDPDEALANQAAAKRLDPRFSLTPAEASGNPLAAAAQGKLGKSPEGSQMLYDRGMERQGVQKDIINNLVNDISPNSVPAASDIRSVSQKIIQDKEQALMNKARPYYQKAEKLEIEPTKFKELIQNPKIAQTVKEVLGDPVYTDELAGFSPNSLKVLDMVKKRLGDEIDTITPTIGSKGQKYRAGVLTGIKNKLVSAMDEVSPDYKQARNIYSEDLPAIQKIRDSKIAKFANMNDEQLKTVTRDIFDPAQTNPKIMAMYRNEISKESPEAWNQIVRNHIENTLDNTEATGSVFYSKLLKGDRQFIRLLEATKNIPGANQKIKDMRLTFKNLINPVTVKTAAGQSKSSTFTPDNRNFRDSAITAIHNMLGGHYDKAAVELVTGGKWDKAFATLRNIENKNLRAQKTALLLGNIAASQGANTLRGYDAGR